MVEPRRRDLLACLVKWARLRDKDSMDSHPLMSNPFTPHHPPMVCSQFTVSQSMLNQGLSTANPCTLSLELSTLILMVLDPPTVNPCTPSLELSTHNPSKSMASLSSSPIRLSELIVPSLTVHPSIPKNQHCPKPPQMESSVVL